MTQAAFRVFGRPAMFALSAVLLSGCSWLGGGHGGYGAYGKTAGGSYGACAQGFDSAAYGQVNCGAGYGVQGYGMQGYGAQGYGMQGYAGQYAELGGAGVGYQGAYGVAGQQGVIAGQQTGLGAFGNGSVTTLSGAAPYGAAIGAGTNGFGVGQAYGQNVVGAQYANGQFGQAVQTVQGAPIYVPQPYGVPVGVGVAGAAVGAALPWGLAALGGTDFDVNGDILDAKPAGPAFPGDYATATGEAGAQNAISYDDAFGQSKRIGGALERDLGPNTTLIGQFAYANSNGRRIDNAASFTPGGYVDQVFAPTGETQFLDAEFSDLNTYTAEAGIRKYVGHGYGLRPYVGATAGAVYNEGVDLTQYQAGTDQAFSTVEFIDSGWNPTASGVVGAELPVGSRGSVGVESGIRWTDGVDTVVGGADDRLSIPLTLRGRVAF